MNTPIALAGADGKQLTTLGIVAIVLGLLCMAAPVITGLSIALVLGILVLTAGVARLIWAFKTARDGQAILKFAVGGLTLLVGLLLVANPVFAAGVLTIVLSLYFILDGVSEIAAGMGTKQGWLTFAGVISILLGVLLWAQFPLSGAWALGILFGLKLLLIGIIMLTGGSAVRSFAKV